MFVILATVFLWTVTISCSDFMSTDDHSSKPDPESFVALLQAGDAQNSVQDVGDKCTSSDASAAVDNDDEYKGPIFRAALNSDALFPQVMSGEDEQHELPCFSDVDGQSASQFEHAPHAGASTDVPASRSEVNRALFEARMSSMPDVEIKMPWEQGIMKQIFDSDDDSIFPTI